MRSRSAFSLPLIAETLPRRFAPWFRPLSNEESASDRQNSAAFDAEFQAAYPNRRPEEDRDFEEKFWVRRDGYILTPDLSNAEIDRLLPERVSRFFLFDGELLDEYERLLSDVDKQSQRIREAIEDIL